MACKSQAPGHKPQVPTPKPQTPLGEGLGQTQNSSPQAAIGSGEGASVAEGRGLEFDLFRASVQALVTDARFFEVSYTMIISVTVKTPYRCSWTRNWGCRISMTPIAFRDFVLKLWFCEMGSVVFSVPCQGLHLKALRCRLSMFPSLYRILAPMSATDVTPWIRVLTAAHMG